MNLCQKMMFSSVVSTLGFNAYWHSEFDKFADDYYSTEYPRAIDRLPKDFCALYTNSDPINFHDWQLGDFRILPNRDVGIMIYHDAPETDGIEMHFYDVHPLTVMYGHDCLPTFEDDKSSNIMYFCFERVPKSKSKLTLTILLSFSMVITFSFQRMNFKEIGLRETHKKSEA